MDPTSSVSSEKLRILHVVETLLPITETFVRQRLDSERFESLALTWKRVESGLTVSCPSVCLPLDGDREVQQGRTAIIGWWKRRIRCELDLLKVLRDFAPDVVHAHFGPAALRVDRECGALGIPLVVSFYGYDASPAISDRKRRRSYKRLFASDAVLTAEGPVLAKKLIALGARSERVKLLPLSLPLWALRPPERALPFDTPAFCLLQVARFVEKKGIDTTLQVVARGRSLGADLHLILAGDGPLLPTIREQIERLRLSDIVELTGLVSHDELPHLFSRAHAIIQPSRRAADGDTEGGAPVVLLEAQAQGLPVIATEHADLPTIVRHGQSGYLSPEGDLNALTDDVMRLARDRRLVGRLGETGRSFVLARHDPSLLAKLQERIYYKARGLRRSG